MEETVNRAAVACRVTRNAELLSLMSMKHPAKEDAEDVLSDIDTLISNALDKLSDDFSPEVLSAHTWYNTDRKETFKRDSDGHLVAYPAHRGGTVVCNLTLEKGGEIFTGLAKCVDVDRFDGRFGRQLALFRARCAAQEALDAKKSGKVVSVVSSYNTPATDRTSNVDINKNTLRDKWFRFKASLGFYGI